MVARFTELGVAQSTVHYFERDGYYARNDPEHRRASFRAQPIFTASTVTIATTAVTVHARARLSDDDGPMWEIEPRQSRNKPRNPLRNYVQCNNTPVKVLAPGTGKTATGRAWGYVRDERP